MAVAGDVPDGCVLVTGELDILTAPRLNTLLMELLHRGYRQVNVDAAGVDFCGAAGLNVLCNATRWCEARLRLHDIGQAHIRHLVLDVSRARRATPTAVALLDHARIESARRHVEIHLVGAGLIMATSSTETRRHLGRWSTFPTVDSARAALDPHAGDRSPSRPVDPDAILLI